VAQTVVGMAAAFPVFLRARMAALILICWYGVVLAARTRAGTAGQNDVVT